MQRPEVKRPHPILLAIAVTAAVQVLRLALLDVVGEQPPYLPFVLGVVIAAIYGGLLAGLIGTGLSAAFVLYNLGTPGGSLRQVEPGQWSEFAAFMTISLAFSCVSERLHRTRMRLAADRARLRQSQSFHESIADLDLGFAYHARMREDGWLALEAVSDGFTRMLGYTLEEVNERGGIRAIVHSDDGDAVISRLLDPNASDPDRGDVRVVDKDGHEHVMRYIAHRMVENGRLIGVHGATHDITNQREHEKAVEAAEARLGLMAGTTTTILWTADRTGRFKTPQPSWSVHTGQNWEEMRDYGWVQAVHPADRDRVLTAWKSAWRSNIPFESTGRLWHAFSHSYRQFEVNAVPILASDGTVREWVGECRDIEDRIKAENSVVEITEQLKIVTDSMSAAVARCSRELRYLWVSRMYAKWLGSQPEDVVGRKIAEVIGDEAFERMRPYVERALAGETVSWELQGRIHRLGQRWVLAVYTPTWGDDGVPDGWVVVALDVDERRRAEQEVRDADRRKDEFLATLAHELRNPLAPIRSALHVLRGSAADASARELAGAIMDRQVRHMVRLVDDLLDVSRVTRGMLEIRHERVEISGVLSDAIETSRPLIASSGHELSVSLPHEALVVEGDSVRLSQVFSNLINNASKYMNPGGKIWVAAERRQDLAVITVRDAGFGIPAQLRSRIFDMFEQARTENPRATGGLGVGLTLVKRLVELHGGSVEVGDGEGGGTRFTVQLPLAPDLPASIPATAAPAVRAADRAHARRILVADDNEDAASSLTMMLQLMGHEVFTAYDGVEALEMAEARRPDVILLDIGMPRMNGFDVARKIRESRWAAETILVAVTGWGADEDKQRSRDSGFDYHLVKPANPQTLEELLNGGPPAEVIAR